MGVVSRYHANLELLADILGINHILFVGLKQ